MRQLHVPTIRDHRGNLAVVQQTATFPFVPARVMWGTELPTVVGPGAAIKLAEPERLELLDGGEKLSVAGTLQIALFPASEPEESTPAAKHAHRTSSVDRCVVIPQIELNAGGCQACAPFAIRRIYFLYATPADARRGGHSHFVEHRLLVAIAGSFRVVLSDGRRRRTVLLSNPGEALYIPPGIWRELDRFAPGSVCLAMSSTEYDPNDYVRSALRFRALTMNSFKLLPNDK